MKSFLLSALQSIVRALVGSLNYQRILDLVLNAEASTLTSKEKRELVIDEARNIGLAVGNALLNLAIETAVNTLRK